MNWPLRERWLSLCPAEGAGDAAAWYERVTAAYAEPHRHYHNQQHLVECLAEFDLARQLAGNATAVELALWFHDAVYFPRAADNEERSALLSRECLSQLRLPQNQIESVRKLIMATKHHDVSAHPDAGLMVDVDLSILGREAERFFSYEHQIREECAWVPWELFAAKRSEILAAFLARRRIYATDWFYQKYELPARKNVAASINKLRQPPPGI